MIPGWLAALVWMLLSLVLLLLAIGLGLRIVTVWRERRYQAWAQAWEEPFFAFVFSPGPVADVPSIARGQLAIWERFLYTYMKKVQGEERQRVVDLASRTGLLDRLRHRLERGNRWGKARAMMFLGLGRVTEALPAMREQLHSPDRLVALAAARGLARMGDVDSLPQLVETVRRRSFFTYEAISDLLADFGNDACPQVLRMLEEAVPSDALIPLSATAKAPQDSGQLQDGSSPRVEDPELVCLYVDFLTYFRYRGALPALVTLLTRTDHEEIAIHCLKFLEQAGDANHAHLALPWLRHQVWALRLHAVKALSATAPEAYLPEKEALLEDPAWWVRYRTAQGLALAGPGGRAVLERVAASSAVAAAEMAQQFLWVPES